MSKFTQGPWGTRKALTPTDGAFDFAIEAVVEGRPCCIAEAFGRVAPTIYPDAEANARLIAAAPAMYAALQEVAEFLEGQADVNWEGDGPNRAMSLLNEVNAALAQADGKQP